MRISLPGSLLSGVVRLFTGGSSAAPQPAAAETPAQADDSAQEADADKKAKEDTSWWDQWLTECYAGRHRPEWTSRMAPPLEKMLAAADAKERIAAALVLAPLGKTAAALPVLGDTARANRDRSMSMLSSPGRR